MARIKDEVGNRYGMLLVLEFAGINDQQHAAWKCLCNCGEEKIASGVLLRLGRTKSCGCLRRLDEVGNRYGKLVVLRYFGVDKNQHAMWECLCDCGNKKIAKGILLREEKIKSCGCLRTFPTGVASFNNLFGVYKREAKRRNLIFDLTEKEFKKVTSDNCYYCGLPPSTLHQPIHCNGPYTHNGLDRINNLEGYTSENIVPCCVECNYAKGKRTEEEFLYWIERVYSYQQGGESA